MSKTMNIQFGPDMATSAVEVLSPDLQTIHWAALSAGEGIHVEVPSVDSFIRLHLPSRKVITLHHQGDLEYLVTRRQIAQPSAKGMSQKGNRQPNSQVSYVNHLMEELTFPGLVKTSQTFSKTKQESVNFLSGEQRNDSHQVDLSKAVNYPVLQPTPDESYRNLSVDNEYIDSHALEGGVQVSWLPPVDGSISQDLSEFEFDLKQTEAPRELLIDGQTRYHIRVPGNAEYVSVRSDLVDEANRVISVRVSTVSEKADVVGSYLLHGDYYAAEAMTDWASRQAESMLTQKIYDPYEATVLAYLLLRLERYDLLHNWPKSLAHRFPTIVDSSIIWAAQCALVHKDLEQAKNYIDQAILAGLPVYTEGLRILTDLLRRMGEFGQEYLKMLAEKIDGVIWNSPFTALASQVSSEGESMSLDVAYTSSF
jgi:hypothetical protein